MANNFLFGTSTAAHQIEGDNTNNDWWLNEKKMTGGVGSGRACNSYELFDEDLKAIKDMNNNSYRMSLEWSRIQPTKDKFSQTAMEHYVKWIDKLIDNGIEPIVTLHHFTNPLWFAELGEWTSKDAPKYFAEYVDFVMRHLKGKVKVFNTINEPNVYTVSKYLIGFWFPYEKDLMKSYTVINNFLEGHKLAYDIIHEYSPNSIVGIAVQEIKLDYQENNYAGINKFISAIADNINNHYIFDQLRDKYLDMIAFNYYTQISLTVDPTSVNTFMINTADNLANRFDGADSMPISFHPEGLIDICERMFNTYKLPILITENGIDTAIDRNRVKFLHKVFDSIDNVIQKGIPLIGYTHWSLTDNFEWALAYKSKFGLYKIGENFERIAKPSALVYGQLIKEFQQNNLGYLTKAVPQLSLAS